MSRDHAALDAGRVHEAAAAWLHIPPSATRLEGEDFLAVRYPDWSKHPLQLVRFRPERPVAEALDEVVARCTGLGVERLCCWVRADAPPDLEEELRDRGAVRDEILDVLARSLVEVPELDPDPAVELRWTDTLETFGDAVRVGAEVFGGSSIGLDTLEAEFRGEAEKYRSGAGGAVVAYLEGRPVGSAGITVAGRDGRLWGGGVLPEARGRGVYRAMLLARLEYGVANGTELALVKGRVDTSAPILRRAGFAAYGQERSYLLAL